MLKRCSHRWSEFSGGKFGYSSRKSLTGDSWKVSWHPAQRGGRDSGLGLPLAPGRPQGEPTPLLIMKWSGYEMNWCRGGGASSGDWKENFWPGEGLWVGRFLSQTRSRALGVSKGVRTRSPMPLKPSGRPPPPRGEWPGRGSGARWSLTSEPGSGEPRRDSQSPPDLRSRAGAGRTALPRSVRGAPRPRARPRRARRRRWLGGPEAPAEGHPGPPARGRDPRKAPERTRRWLQTGGRNLLNEQKPQAAPSHRLGCRSKLNPYRWEFGYGLGEAQQPPNGPLYSSRRSHGCLVFDLGDLRVRGANLGWSKAESFTNGTRLWSLTTFCSPLRTDLCPEVLNSLLGQLTITGTQKVLIIGPTNQRF